MPITIAKFKCNECEDVFEATSEEWFMCKCEKSEVKPSKFSTSYKREKGMCFTNIETNTYYFEEDFLIFDEKLERLYEDVKVLAESLGFKEWTYHEKGQDNTKFLSALSLSKGERIMDYSSEYNNIEIHIGMSRKYDRPSYEDIASRLKQFKAYLHEMKAGKIELKDRRALLKYSDDNDVYWSREQLEEYDYKFSF